MRWSYGGVHFRAAGLASARRNQCAAVCGETGRRGSFEDATTAGGGASSVGVAPASARQARWRSWLRRMRSIATSDKSVATQRVGRRTPRACSARRPGCEAALQVAERRLRGGVRDSSSRQVGRGVLDAESRDASRAFSIFTRIAASRSSQSIQSSAEAA